MQRRAAAGSRRVVMKDMASVSLDLDRGLVKTVGNDVRRLSYRLGVPNTYEPNRGATINEMVGLNERGRAIWIIH